MIIMLMDRREEEMNNKMRCEEEGISGGVVVDPFWESLFTLSRVEQALKFEVEKLREMGKGGEGEGEGEGDREMESQQELEVLYKQKIEAEMEYVGVRRRLHKLKVDEEEQTHEVLLIFPRLCKLTTCFLLQLTTFFLLLCFFLSHLSSYAPTVVPT